MLQFKVVKKGNELEKRIKNLLKANGEDVKVGHFKSQGTHQSSGMTYVNLMMMHHTGVPSKNIPARKILTVVKAHNTSLSSKSEVKQAMKGWAASGYGPSAAQQLWFYQRWC